MYSKNDTNKVMGNNLSSSLKEDSKASKNRANGQNNLMSRQNKRRKPQLTLKNNLLKA